MELANPCGGNEREFDPLFEIRLEIDHAAIAVHLPGGETLQRIRSFVGAVAQRADHVPAQVEDPLESGVQKQVERRPPIRPPFVCKGVGSDAGEIEVVALLEEPCQPLTQATVVSELAEASYQGSQTGSSFSGQRGGGSNGQGGGEALVVPDRRMGLTCLLRIGVRRRAQRTGGPGTRSGVARSRRR